MAFSNQDIHWMLQALSLAKKGRYFTRPNPCVGALIVQHNTLLAEGYHRAYGHAHAEVDALLTIVNKAARGATCYVTLEPCSHTGKTPPCTQALIEAGISRVVIATEDPNPLVRGRGIAQLRAAGIQVEVGLLALQARAQNPAFHYAMCHPRPYIVLKSAMSLDGHTAMADGSSQWITGPSARAEVQAMREKADAIVTGVGTVLKDDPQLNVRLPRAGSPLFRQPIRIILDSQLRTPLHARIFQSPGEVIIATCQPSGHAPFHAKAKIWVLPEEKGRISIPSLVQRLKEEGLCHIMVESGPMVHASFLAAGCVDEWVIFIAPKLMGIGARPLISTVVERLCNAPGFTIQDTAMIGDDLCVKIKPIL